MKVLFVCLSHFPYAGACSSLIRKITGEPIFINNCEIHVLTIRKSIAEPETERYGKIIIYRLWWWEVIPKSDIRQWLFKYPFTSLRGYLHKVVTKMYVRISGNDFINKLTSRSIYRSLKHIHAEKFDAIIPVAGHYETVFASLTYADRHHGNVIIYQVDPCSANKGYSIRSSELRRNYEKQMYISASAIITTPILLHEWMGKFSGDSSCKIIAMEFPNVNPYSTARNTLCKCPARKYNCVFAGAIYKAARNPSYTFKLFAALAKNNIHLCMVGVERQSLSEFKEIETVPENITFHGIVPLEQAQKFIEEADILVNIGNVMTNQVPSKIFEYISSGKPIVNICVSHDCPTLPYLEKYPYVLNLFECDTDFEDQVYQLKNFITGNSGKCVSPEYINREYETCTAQYCAKQMLDIINQTIIQ